MVTRSPTLASLPLPWDSSCTLTPSAVLKNLHGVNGSPNNIGWLSAPYEIMHA